MLTMLGHSRRFCDGLTRRESLQVGAASLCGGLTLPQLLQAEQQGAGTGRGKAKTAVVLYLHGGAPTQDMYDMKPTAPIEVRGEFKPVATTAPGIEICEHLPLSAKWMHRSAIVRTVNHRANCHNTVPSYTGWEEPLTDLSMIKDSYPPSMGSVIEYLKPPTKDLPDYLYLPTPLQWGSAVPKAGPYAGFLGKRYDPVETMADVYLEKGVRGDVREDPPLVKGIPRLPDQKLADGVTLDRLSQRRGLLDQLDGERRRLDARVSNAVYDRFQQKAFDVLTSNKLREAFDPSRITTDVLRRYTDTIFGTSTYIASNLVTAGVRFINVLWDWYNVRIPGIQDFGWDTHMWNFQILKKYLPIVDTAFNSLLEDLEASGLLDETLVVIMSDFGRTPHVNKDAGRDHWSHCYSVLFTGAGIRGGTIYGQSDQHAAVPVDRPVSTSDICATIYECLGIDPHFLIHDRLGRPVPIAQGGSAIRDILA